MLYGVEINEPFQIQNEQKFKCWMSVGEDEEHAFAWTTRQHRTFATENEEFAAKLAALLPESWDAEVQPLDVDEDEKPPVVFAPETEKSVVKAFTARAREAQRQRRQIR